MFELISTSPPDHETRSRAIGWLVGSYSGLKVLSIGKSVLGREIKAICFGDPRAASLFVGATHGLEWLTASLLLRFAGDLAEALSNDGHVSGINVRKAMLNRSLTIVPCLNPDGVEIALYGRAGAGRLGDKVEQISGGDFSTWQANANGVDINHNFDAGWKILRQMERDAGILGPAPSRYGGPHPNSEPETRAIVTHCLAWRPRSLYSFHSQGEEIYYKYGENTPERSRLVAGILAASSGYKIATPEGLASHGGLKDWFIDKLHGQGFTIEVGRGKNPLPLDMLNPVYERIQEMMMIAALL